MITEQQFAELEQRLSALERETYSVLERRLVRNSDAETAILRAETHTRQRVRAANIQLWVIATW